jgi:hypothetical protein
VIGSDGRKSLNIEPKCSSSWLDKYWTLPLVSVLSLSSLPNNMDIISIYAITAGGVFVTLFLISVLPYLYHLAQIIELYISRYLIFPFFFRRHRFAGPWTRAAGLVHLLYTTFNLFCLCFRVSSSADFAGRAGTLAVVNMVALFMAGNPSVYSDIFSISRHTCLQIHRATAWMAIGLLALHVILISTIKKNFPLGQMSNLFAFIVSWPFLHLSLL